MGPSNVSNQNISRAINFKKTTERLDKVKYDASHAGKHRVNNAFTVFSETAFRTFFYEPSRSGDERTQNALSGHDSNVSNLKSNVENSHQNQGPGLRTSEDEHRHVRNMANDTNLAKPGFMLRTSDSKPNIRASNVRLETKDSRLERSTQNQRFAPRTFDSKPKIRASNVRLETKDSRLERSTRNQTFVLRMSNPKPNICATNFKTDWSTKVNHVSNILGARKHFKQRENRMQTTFMYVRGP